MGYSLEEIEKMENDLIREKVSELNKFQIEYIKESSLLNIIISLESIEKILDSEEMKNNNCENEIDSINDIINNYKIYIEELDIKKIQGDRDRLLGLKNIIEGYIVELGYVGELVDENGTKLLAKENKMQYSPENVDKLLHQIDHALEDAQADYGKYSFIVSEIVRVLPMRMVKQNYVEIVKQTLYRNMKNFNATTVDAYIENYKKRFDSSTRNGYGTKFDYYFMQIEKIKREDLEAKTIHELSDLVKIIIDVTDELTKLQDFIISLGIMSNLFIVLDKTSDIDLEEELIIKEWKSIDDEEAREKFVAKVGKKLEQIERKLQESLGDYEKFAIELANREDFDHSLLDDELLITRNILAYYNDINFSDNQFIDGIDINVADDDYIENSIDSLIEHMNRATIDMSNMERKIRMRKLLSTIDLPFVNIKEFGNYIKYSLDSRVLNEDIINFKINQIYYFLNELKDK